MMVVRLLRPRARLPILAASFLLSVVPLSAAGERGAGVRITATAGSFSVEKALHEGRTYRRIVSSLPGRTGGGGVPSLPFRVYLVALPDGDRAVAEIAGEKHRDLSGDPIAPLWGPVPGADRKREEKASPPPTGAWYPDRIVEVGEPVRFRHQRVVPVRVRLFRTIPATGLLRVYDEVDVVVRFVPDGAEKGEEPGRVRAGDDPHWEGIYRSTLVNYEEGKSFRSRVAPPPPGGLPRKKTGPAYKIFVGRGGLYAIPFEELGGAGMAAGSPVGSITIARRGFSDEAFASGEDPFTETLLPNHIDDGDGDGLFGAGDTLWAYLPGFRQDRMERDFEDRFAFETAYFVAAGAAGPPLETRSGWRGFDDAVILSAYADSIRWEEDRQYTIAPVSDTTDLYFPIGNVAASFTAEIDLPAPDTTATYRVKAMTVSTVGGTRPYHRYILVSDATGDTVFNEVVFGSVPALRKSTSTHPDTSLVEGENAFTFRGWRGSSADETTVAGAGGFFDWFEIHTRFLYRAHDGYTRFSTGGESGKVQIEAGGFDGAKIFLFDVTDPYAPVWIEADSIRAGKDGTTLVFQDSVADNRVYVAATPNGARRLAAGKIVAAEEADVAGGAGDYLLVGPDSLLEAVEPLALHRESQGYDVLRVPLDAVWDAFHGGVKDPIALQRFCRYAFERWPEPPAFLLLVGDGYEDYKGVAENGDGDVDIVPAFPIWEPYGDVSGDRWTASDAWYVLLDGSYDYLPEILIGRFPAGSAEEARVLAEKTIRYETENRDAPWRRRTAFVADDAWVQDSYLPYHYDNRQTGFESDSRAMAERIAGDSEIRADTLSLNLRAFTDIYHPECPYGDGSNANYADVECVFEMARGAGGITDAYFDLLNETGVFLLNYQGHGNRTSLSHEIFLVEGRETAYTGRTYHDVSERSAPGAAPYIFMGFGCSISEFERFKSFGYDALGETMVLLPGTGAALTYGSTALEYLGANLTLNQCVLEEFYPPLGSSAGAAAVWPSRTAGEVLTAGMANYVAANYSYDTARRYLILGDPALRIGPDLPSLAVTVDGALAEEGEIHIPHTGGTPLAVEAIYRSDVAAGKEGIVVLEEGVPVDTALYDASPGVDSASGRWTWTIHRDLPAGPGASEIRIEVTDAWGWKTSRTVVAGMEIETTFDGLAYEESLDVAPLTSVAIRFPAGADLEPSEILFEAAGVSASADTIRSEGDTVRVATADLALPEGEQTVSISIGGLVWHYTVRVAPAAITIDGAVDGDSAASGSYLLGHLDGTGPELSATIRSLDATAIDTIRVLDGGETVAENLYAVTRDTSAERPTYRLAYTPVLRHDEYAIRIEAIPAEGAAAAFDFLVRFPITLSVGGVAIADGDFAAPEAEARATALFGGEIPEEEVAFLLDGSPLAVDTLRREGDDHWIAVAATGAAAGTHTIEFRAGAFSAERTFRVASSLGILDPLAYPNPSNGPTGFFYHLTLPADEVRVEIFTVTGRRIRTLTGLSTRAGYNENRDVWDGRDQDGDKPARGVYPFRVIAVRGGERAEAIGKIVRGGRGE